MFDPTDEETAMSPLPCFATRTLVIRSGTEVPAAKNVKPITCEKIQNSFKRLLIGEMSVIGGHLK